MSLMLSVAMQALYFTSNPEYLWIIKQYTQWTIIEHQGVVIDIAKCRRAKYALYFNKVEFKH